MCECECECVCECVSVPACLQYECVGTGGCVNMLYGILCCQ